MEQLLNLCSRAQKLQPLKPVCPRATREAAAVRVLSTTRQQPPLATAKGKLTQGFHTSNEATKAQHIQEINQIIFLILTSYGCYEN